MITKFNPAVKSYTIKDINGTVVGRFSVSKSSSKKDKSKNKKVQYNFKSLSSRILRSKTSDGARQALTMARGKIAMLRRQLQSGEYDSQAIINALAHAEKMARVAKKRMKHFEEEEEAKNTGKLKENEELFSQEDSDDSDEDYSIDDLSEEELDELMERLRDEMAEEMQQFMAESMERLEEESTPYDFMSDMMINVENLSPEDLERIKKKHRSEEMREIVEADMKYLKSLFEQFEKERAQANCGIALELGGIDVPVAPPEMPVMSEGGNVDVSL